MGAERGNLREEIAWQIQTVDNKRSSHLVYSRIGKTLQLSMIILERNVLLFFAIEATLISVSWFSNKQTK